MPELPEVETTKNAISPHIEGNIVKQVIIRQPKLRWPVSPQLKTILPELKINNITRRAKYLIFNTEKGNLIIHLGMSGKLQLIDYTKNYAKHDHIDIIFNNNKLLRYNDTRRFGCVLWVDTLLEDYKLFRHLGPEPLSKNFSVKFLYNISRNKNTKIKQFIMEQKYIVGVGNIYACEALFLAKIHPCTPAKSLSLEQCNILVTSIKTILKKAIKAGGTTLKDFFSPDGSKGYFVQKLSVYGRAGEACFKCDTKINSKVIAQRNTFYCEECQAN